MVRYAIVGAGQRGAGYAELIGELPGAQVVAVAEPRAHQRERLARRHGVTHVFSSWEELAAAPRLADAAVVSTQDAEHIGPAVALARKGYHLLVEKPLAPTPEECAALVGAVTEAGVLFAVCHVMRYRPYTRLVKQLVDDGRIGEVVSVQHLEPVGHWHYAHSYVRGNWRRTDEASFMLLAKSGHDIDWLRHIVGRPIERVSSFGSLRHFTAENAPAGSADRCLDCGVEPVCPYSAPRLYLGMVRGGRTGWPVSVLADEVTEASVTRALREGPYGRCVYRCDNDVVDHQVVAMEFAGGTTATFTMTAFTPHTDRRTQIFGTRGFLDGDGIRVRLHDFVTETTEVLTVPNEGVDTDAGHAGGDAGLVAAFTTAVATGDATHILSGPAESLESHLAVFAAERARLTGTVERVHG
ncbi:Gfo/Idh/MocA family protein [Actinophytocola algeriensis]|uniref:Putative dehydrogenase n=1 Tax=Actinophytocola algeriensis TaxID=1768010 RepID=A0A7W7QDC5_9PSEU|nr:Gfo/Idh/MocA family oxidoreductase [Actinophytocola algeriensis]MBB4911179.1 putative dehydrogenase [Actinophytocola algeriensis]MBE1479118.1 putative dehydrogenase [Actinophytocola algeriensis]